MKKKQKTSRVAATRALRAALYARYSTEKQSEASIKDQHRVCERIADREGFNIVARFSDAAISGGTSQRPGYQSLLQAARAREIDVIVAEDTSRLWRELSEQWRALKELSDLGIHVVGHGLDTRREESKILLAVNGAMAEAYRDEIARRTRRGLEGLAREGKPTGGKAYGYVAARDSKSGEIEIDKSQAKIVRRIFEMYANDKSPRAIAAKLNEEGVPSPGSTWKRETRRKDGLWMTSAIAGDRRKGTGILNNARYIGMVSWGRTEWKRGAADSKKRTVRTAKAAHERQDERLRIVSDELWKRVRQRQTALDAEISARITQGPSGMSREKAKRTGRKASYVLSGILRCGLCESSLSVTGHNQAYACSTRSNAGKGACANDCRLPRADVEPAILDGVKAQLMAPEFRRAFDAEVKRILDEQRKNQGADGEARRKRIAQLDREIERFVQAVADGVAVKALRERIVAAEEERARLTDEEARTTPSKTTEQLPEVAMYYARLVKQAEQGFHGDVEKARDALRGLFENGIKVTPDPKAGGYLVEGKIAGGTVLRMALGHPHVRLVAGGRYGRLLARLPWTDRAPHARR